MATMKPKCFFLPWIAFLAISLKTLLTEERCYWIQVKATFHLTQVSNMYIKQDKFKKK